MQRFKQVQYGLLIGLVLTLTTGCIPAAFVAGAGATGMVVYDKRNMLTMMEDRDMTNLMLKKLGDDPQLREQTHIAVASFNHVMLLAGQASNDALRTRVYQLANSIPNVKRIYNQITVEPPIDSKTEAQDSWITAKVKSLILAERGINSNQVKVVTENGVVYLMGVMTHGQADTVADVASHVSGVTQVVKIFEYEQ
ncbi:MAG: BON domain-containing protein [Gammaproteobacteria bacterium]